MKTITTLLLFLSSTILFGQETDTAKGIPDMFKDIPIFQFMDSLKRGTASWDDKRILFIRDSSAGKVLVDRAYFDNYREKHKPKVTYTMMGIDTNKTSKGGGYTLLVHMPNGGLTKKEYKTFYKELRTREKEKEK